MYGENFKFFATIYITKNNLLEVSFMGNFISYTGFFFFF